MLVLLFTLGGNRYGIEARSVVEVLPDVDLRPIPHAPPHVRGTFNYRGELIPVVDLQQLTVQKPCEPRLSTRIMAVAYQSSAAGGTRTLGILAEDVTEAQEIDASRLEESPVAVSNAPYLGKFLSEGGESVQFIRLDRLLAPAIDSMLFKSSAPAAK